MKKLIVFGVAALASLTTVAVSGCKTGTVDQPTQTTTTNPVIAGTTAQPTARITSVYDGTYTGVFNYEYQKRASLDDVWLETGAWTPASFTVTLTFKTVEITGDYIKLNITKVTCSEAAFGAVDGVVPWQNDDTYAYLPANPPTSITNPASKFMGINISFPNFLMLQMPTLTRDGIAVPGGLAVGDGGNSIGYTTEPAIAGWTWLASTPTGVFMNPSAWGYYRHRFISWNLTRISN